MAGQNDQQLLSITLKLVDPPIKILTNVESLKIWKMLLCCGLAPFLTGSYIVAFLHLSDTINYIVSTIALTAMTIILMIIWNSISFDLLKLTIFQFTSLLFYANVLSANISGLALSIIRSQGYSYTILFPCTVILNIIIFSIEVIIGIPKPMKVLALCGCSFTYLVAAVLEYFVDDEKFLCNVHCVSLQSINMHSCVTCSASLFRVLYHVIQDQSKISVITKHPKLILDDDE